MVSDCGAISDFWGAKKHNTHPDAAHASADAVLSGTDLECGSNYRKLTDAVKAGIISEEQIDISVKRLLKARFELGEMGRIPSMGSSIQYCRLPGTPSPGSANSTRNHDAPAKQRKYTPLDQTAKVAVIGPNANDSVMQWGNYNGTPSHTSTLLSALRSKLPAAQLIYEPVCGLTDDITFNSLFNQCSYHAKPGFTATYWNNPDFKGEADATVQLSTPFRFTTLGATAFAPGIELTGFTGRYQTVFRPKKSGNAIFRFQTNGDIRVNINGEEVIKTGNIKNPENLYTLQAQAGKSYEIVIEFKQIKDGAYFNFRLGGRYSSEYECNT